ncbi:hypothetical protein ACFE04_016410 [Oxalis oulophora]
MTSSSSSSSTSESLIGRGWENCKEFWGERFSFMEHYSRFIKLENPLPSWTSDDVDQFIASDPLHGPTLKKAREAATFGAVGSALGALHLGGLSWKYSKSMHGAGMAVAAGAFFGWTFGQEAAEHWYQLYRLDTPAAQTKFLEWWQKKSERQS